MPLHVASTEARYVPSSEERVTFQRQHWVRLSGFLEVRLLDRVVKEIARAVFDETAHRSVAERSVDLRSIGCAASEVLVLVCNDPVVLRGIEDITGCRPLTRFNGSIYRMTEQSGHQQSWHDDLVDGRRVTLSVNLGAGYRGGELQLRQRGAARAFAVVPNTCPGDAVLFRLDESIEHRVTPVTSGVKTAFAGWFRRGRPLRDELKRSVELVT
jgi:2-oxoglutarate-Fe(II)-dependent oxygenase superfamily protein